MPELGELVVVPAALEVAAMIGLLGVGVAAPETVAELRRVRGLPPGVAGAEARPMA